MKHVLVIDDDASLRAVITTYLRERGWQLLEAEDGENGISLARKHRPAAVVCDLLLPRMNGFQVCSTLRGVPELSQVKIIAVSGRNYEANRVMALEAGADAFLPKPVKPGELHQLLHRLISRSAADPQLLAPSPESRLKGTLVRFWGVRGSVPVPGPDTVFYGGNTSCIELRADDEIIVLDAGTGIRPLGLRLVEEFRDQPLELTLLISHTHWDHIQGFPFFLPAYEPKNRIHILGYEGARDGLASVLSGQMESPYFPIGLKELPGNILIKEMKELEFRVGKVRVQANFMNHPGICMGYRLSTSCGAVAYLPDNEPFYRSSLSSDTQFTPKVEGLEYAQTEDLKMVEFIQQADILIIDSQYDSEEYQAHAGWGHGCLDEVVRLALKGRVKRLILFHHDPSHDDRKISSMAEQARKLVADHKSDLVVEAAREGAEIELAPTSSKPAATPTQAPIKRRV